MAAKSQLEIGSTFARHEILSVAGQGGMGIVYRARDLELEREVALKLISSEFSDDVDFRERFRRESRLAARIRHPNAVTVFQASEENGLLFITMDFIEGMDLGRLIETEGRLDPERAAELIGQVSGALDEVHLNGLVHRDIKPGNALIGHRGGQEHAFLTDFGLSRSISSDSALTKTGFFVGTLNYAAPEQLRGDPVDARADVYALGCLLHHALVGTVPYPVDTPEAQMAAHFFKPPPSPHKELASVPQALDDVVQRATAKDPKDRFPSAGDLGRAARAAAAGHVISQPERSVATGDAKLVGDRPGATEHDRPAIGATEVDSPPLPPPGGPYAQPPRPAPPPPPPPPPGAFGAPTVGTGGSGRSSRAPLYIAAGIAGALILAILLVVLLAGGGDEAGPGPTTTEASTAAPATPAKLDLALVKPKVVAYMKSFFGDDDYVPEPECPADVDRVAAAEFDCTDTDGDGLKTVVRVKQTDDRGGTSLTLARYEILAAYIAKDIKQEYDKDPDAAKVRRVTCPRLFDAAKLPRFQCTVTFVDADTRRANVRITKQDGTFTWAVRPDP